MEQNHPSLRLKKYRKNLTKEEIAGEVTITSDGEGSSSYNTLNDDKVGFNWTYLAIGIAVVGGGTVFMMLRKK